MGPGMSQPAVSVILPIYNGERYLEESLRSVLTQSRADYELIAWDDGSHDRSASIAASFRDNRVRYFRNDTNLGLFPTLNLAIQQARAPLIRLWAQDDRMKPHCLQRELEFWAAHPEIGMSYCARDIIDATGQCLAPASPDATPDVVEPWLANQISFYWGCMPGNIATVMIRKDVLEKVGPFATLRVSGDFEMWTRIMEEHAVGFIREPLIELRRHVQQFSRWKEVAPDFIREDRQIFSTLAARLPAQLQCHARSYQRRRAVRYLHQSVRLLAAGQVALARQVFQEVRREANPFLVVLLWLVTLNGRVARLSPMYVSPTGEHR